MTTTLTQPGPATEVAGPGAWADMRPVAVYGRISKKDRREGAGANVKIEDQLAQAAAYAAAHFPNAPVLEFRDNASAWDPTVVRDEYEAMVSMLATGQLQAIIPWHSDRLTRQPLQQETVWALLKANRAQLHSVRSGHIENPLTMRVEAALAASESDQKSARLIDSHRRNAEAGKFSGGPKQFGYTAGMTAIVPAEERALKEAAQRVLAGATLKSVVRYLEAEGVPTARGGKWTSSNLGSMLKRPSLAGIRVHKGPDGVEVRTQATWPAIFSEETHQALLRVLGDADRRTTPGGNARKHLLAGLAKCGVCGAPLRGRPQRKGKPRPGRPSDITAERAYACDSGAHCWRAMGPMDLEVVEQTIRRLEKSDASGLWMDDSAQLKVAEAQVELDNIETQRAEAVAMWRAKTISTDTLTETTTQLDTDKATWTRTLDAAKEATRKPLAALDGMTGEGVARPAWEKLEEAGDLGRQRVIIDLLWDIRLFGKGDPQGRRLVIAPKEDQG